MVDLKDKNIGYIHFVGIAGIGMSAIAQAYRESGFKVSGSDRSLHSSENSKLFDCFRRQGIRLYEQDGSFLREQQTSVIVYSTAIESDNPDFSVSESIEKWHRSKALSELVTLNLEKTSIAITGSCGKTTVTAWISEAMTNLNLDPLCLNGGMITSFSNEKYSGNFRNGNGNFFIYEADESDKSLLAFSPDYSVILNLGTDHYSREELIEVFEKFLINTKIGAVVDASVLQLLKKEAYSHLKIISVGKTLGSDGDFNLLKYRRESEDSFADFVFNEEKFSLKLPIYGEHNAINSLFVLALLQMVDHEKNLFEKIRSVEKFNGVSRRFELKGFLNANGAKVIDDYAHNVEKIASCIKTGQEICKGRVFSIFQPHGYGPFKFMREHLFPELEKCLRENDQFILLPVFYAGGTSSFSPKAEEVQTEYDSKTSSKDRYLFFNNRKLVTEYLKSVSSKDDLILIMGARDNSLSIWSSEITLYSQTP